MSYSFDYAAYSVYNGEIDYISTVHTKETAKNLVEYWKKFPHLKDSFYCRQDKVPTKYREMVAEYWREYEESFPKRETEIDSDALPFMG